MRQTLEDPNAKQYDELKQSLEEIKRLCDVSGENSKEQIKAIVVRLLEE